MFKLNYPNEKKITLAVYSKGLFWNPTDRGALRSSDLLTGIRSQFSNPFLSATTFQFNFRWERFVKSYSSLGGSFLAQLSFVSSKPGLDVFLINFKIKGHWIISFQENKTWKTDNSWNYYRPKAEIVIFTNLGSVIMHDKTTLSLLMVRFHTLWDKILLIKSNSLFKNHIRDLSNHTHKISTVSLVQYWLRFCISETQ